MQIGSVAIVGAGAVGSYYGCRMAQAGAQTGAEVRFLLRGDYEKVRQNGFQLRSVNGDFGIESPKVYQRAEEMGPVDLVILAWKATANEHAEEVIAPLLHAETKILTLQNGLGNVELLETLFGRGRVLGGLCFVCINRLSAGEIVHSGGGMVTVGEPEETGVLSQLPELFGEKVELRTTDNLAQAQWRKLVWNIPFNGLCVREGGIDTEALLALPGMEGEVVFLMREVQAAGQALGCDISDRFLQNQVELTRPMGAYKPSSMLDFVNGYPLEVEAIWGEPVRRAEEVGVKVPRMKELYETIRGMDSGR